MKILSWNVNGLGARIEAVKRLAQELQPDLICVQKERVKGGGSFYDVPGYLGLFGKIDKPNKQRGTVGAGNLNIELQNAINPSGPALTRGGYIYRQGDKVMQIWNNYDKSVFNGDIGYITAVNTYERTVTVTFDGRLVEYDISELDELTLAYAITIHKSQGSEFPVVVMPITMKHFVMLQRNLIYTGITRAKKICVLVGTTKALAYAVHNHTVSKRNTKLKERLQL